MADELTEFEAKLLKWLVKSDFQMHSECLANMRLCSLICGAWVSPLYRFENCAMLLVDVRCAPFGNISRTLKQRH